MFRRSFLLVLAVSLLAVPLIGTLGSNVLALSGSEFQAGRIIDDAKFFTSSPPMSVSDIQNFLNSKVPVCDTNGTKPYNGGPQTRAQWAEANGKPLPPYTCLKDYHTTIPTKDAEAGLCGSIATSGASAAEIISWVGQSCGINPQVLIVLLQKEQSLITDDWPWPIQYRSATGYGCPDTAPCDELYYGFFNQVYSAARQFKRYGRDPQLFNYRPNSNSNILYNPNTACGSSTVFIQNQATAGLYNYTPYQPNASALNNLYGTGDSCGAYGNRNFWRMFNDWFGSTFGPPDYSCRNGTDVTSVPSGAKLINNQFYVGQQETFTLSFLNNTGSKCIENHTWGYNYQNWITNVASNHPAIDPSNGEVISGNIYGDAKSELVFVKYRNTGSGRIEIHTWDTSYQRWVSNVATNHPTIDPADGKVIASDVNGDGRDELVFVKYRNTGSGRIEIHTWGVNQQYWISNVASNMPNIDPGDGRVITANLYGDIRDELVFVKYRNTGSGRIEIHTWGVNQQYWISNVATNHPTIDPNDIDVTAGNMYGGSIDELVLVKYRNTGSGRIEIHTWGVNQQYWISNVATNHPTL